MKTPRAEPQPLASRYHPQAHFTAASAARWSAARSACVVAVARRLSHFRVGSLTLPSATCPPRWAHRHLRPISPRQRIRRRPAPEADHPWGQDTLTNQERIGEISRHLAGQTKHRQAGATAILLPRPMMNRPPSPLAEPNRRCKPLHHPIARFRAGQPNAAGSAGR